MLVSFRPRPASHILFRRKSTIPQHTFATLYTYLLAQDAVIFPDARHIRINTPQAREIVGFLRALYTKGLTTGSQDFSAATQAFTDGEGGISPSARG